MSNKLLSLILLLIIVLGAGLRLFWLQKSPPSLNWDEAALGYNAYSLLKTGKDEYGFKLPVTFRSFDDYKPPLYPYAAVPFVAMFGLNEISVRLPSALSGISIIVVVFFIASHLFNKKIATLAAFFIAIEPWSVHFSRIAFETNLGLSFLLWSIYFALKAGQKQKYLYISFFLLFLSAYSYHAYRALLLPLTFYFLYFNKKILKAKSRSFPLLIFISLFLISFLFIIKSGGGLVRFQTTSILKAVEFNETPNPVSFIYQFYIFGKNIIGRYFAYFSPTNLFVRGTNEPNQQIPGFGPFYTIEFIFFLSGIVYLAKNKFKPRTFISLILLAPFPAIITWNWFLPTRVLLIFSMYSILIGLGAYNFLIFLRKKGKIILFTNITIFSIVLLNNLGNLATTLFLYLPYVQKGNWQYGFREIMGYVAPIQDKYDKIIFETGHAQPHIFVLFYGKYSPERYHKDLGSPDAVEKPRKNFNFGNYVFRKIYWPEDRNLKKTLFIGSEYNLPEKDVATAKNAKILKDIYDKNGDFMARIVETK